MAEDVTSDEGVLIGDIYFYLHIFTWIGNLDDLVLAIKQMHDLSERAIWHHGKLVTESDGSILYLSVHYKILVLHFVQYWNSQWSVRKPWLKLYLIKNVHEGWSLVPVACLSIQWFNNVSTSKTGDWNPDQVFFEITTAYQEWSEFLLDFFVSSF